MKRRLLSMIYLVANKEKSPIQSTMISHITNKIPCHHEDFFKLTPADQYVLHQLSQYPASTEEKEKCMAEQPREPVQYDTATQLSRMLMDLPADLNYLQVQQARDWLKQLREEEIKENRQTLRLLQRHLIETLTDGNYESYVEESVLKFIEEINYAQKRTRSALV